jgi:hypothetical protein
MYLELRQELGRILKSVELSTQLSILPIELNFQIEEPVDRQFGLLASNLAFIFSKKLKEREDVVVSPQKIAEVVAGLVDQNQFRVSVDGGGFINVEPTKEFIRRFIVKEPSQLNGDILVDWNSVAILEKLRNSEEARYFIRELSNRVIELSHNDSIQLLSILSDPEIDSNAYLRGFSGRENTPSYLLKFKEVVESLPLSAGELVLDDDQLVIEKLLLFRGRLEESVLRSHPERAMFHLLSLVRDFFSQYNRPTTRKLILEQKDLPFLFYASSCGKQVLAALNALKFSCQLPITVL